MLKGTSLHFDVCFYTVLAMQGAANALDPTVFMARARIGVDVRINGPLWLSVAAAALLLVATLDQKRPSACDRSSRQVSRCASTSRVADFGVR